MFPVTITHANPHLRLTSNAFTLCAAGNEKDLAFVNAIVQAGAEMLLKYQRVVETANRR